MQLKISRLVANTSDLIGGLCLVLVGSSVNPSLCSLHPASSGLFAVCLGQSDRMDSRLLIFFIIFSSSRPAGGQQVFEDHPDQISSKQGTILITEDHQHSLTTPRLVEWFVLLGGEVFTRVQLCSLHSSDF